jgi:hypothetical protein
MKATQIVTIKSFSPMFKGEEEASNIHIVNLEENGFDIVAQKSLYQIGDKALYIQPDYCLSNIPLFADFIAPEGNPNKSRLGKQNRIKAVKFGFTDTKGNKVYSNGILLPLQEVVDYINTTFNVSIEAINLDARFDELLGISKYEEPEGKLQGDSKGNLPSGMYKTDETNFNNNSKQLEKLLPCQLIGTVKVDGSSCTVYYKSEEEFGICSRALEKKVFTTNYIGWKSNHFNKDESGVNHGLGYLNETTNEFVLNKNWEEYTTNNPIQTEESIANDDWVKLGYPILEKLREYKLQYSVRCEIFGQSLKGSGNKNNPHAKLPKSILVYGIDDYSSGVCVPLPMKDVIEFCNNLAIPHVEIVFNQQFNTLDEVKDVCNEYFKTNLIEGIVVRTYDTNSYSGKFMNNEYDNLK